MEMYVIKNLAMRCGYLDRNLLRNTALRALALWTMLVKYVEKVSDGSKIIPISDIFWEEERRELN